MTEDAGRSVVRVSVIPKCLMHEDCDLGAGHEKCSACHRGIGGVCSACHCKEKTREEYAMIKELAEIGVIWDGSEEPINDSAGKLAAELATARETVERLTGAVEVACRSGKFGNPKLAAKRIIDAALTQTAAKEPAK